MDIFLIICGLSLFLLQALDFIEKNKSDFGIKRVKHLPVSGAFHTKLMKSATKPLEQALNDVKLELPIVPVHSNVNGYKYKQIHVIKKMLVRQVVEPVKWEQTMHVLYQRKQDEHFPLTFELGPGRQLGTILKMVNKKAHNSHKSIAV